MAKLKNVSLENYKHNFSSGKKILRNMLGKVHLPKRKQRITNTSRIPDPLLARYRISSDRLRLPK